jgi:hypothetical protein
MLESSLPERSMERAGATLPKVIADALRRVPPGEAPVSAWPFVCGSGVAHRTRAMDFHDRVLRVEVPDRAWRSQLMELAPRYVAALNSLVADKVERIHFLLPGEATGAEFGSRQPGPYERRSR